MMSIPAGHHPDVLPAAAAGQRPGARAGAARLLRTTQGDDPQRCPTESQARGYEERWWGERAVMCVCSACYVLIGLSSFFIYDVLVYMNIYSYAADCVHGMSH